jgi:predicted nucleic acid-binding protein
VIVVDVNLIAYLLIGGEHTTESEAVLQRDGEWAAPLLWRSEWRNVLATYLRSGRLSLAEALKRMSAAQALLEGREYLVGDEPVMNLAARSECSAYDCEYVALAETLDVKLVTNDTQVLAAFPERASSPRDFLEGRGQRSV